MDFTALWSTLAPLGRAPETGGYRRYAWSSCDAELRSWFAAECARLSLDQHTDRAGNQWAWWGDPDARPGVVTGSHLDSVPDGGAFDGPLGVVSALLAVAALQAEGHAPVRPIGIVNFADEEGARFGVACMGSRLLTGAIAPERALGLTDVDGLSMADAMRGAGLVPEHVGPDRETLRRVACFLELHVEQGRGLVELDAPVAVGTGIWPHGRWRVELPGEANHAGTTRLADRRDPTLAHAEVVLGARAAAAEAGAVATCGKVLVEPNGVNAIASRVVAWLDARAPEEPAVRRVVAAVTELAERHGGHVREESWTPLTSFDPALISQVRHTLGGVPLLDTGAGHDAGILANAGIPTAMLFVRNPTGVSHSPAEHADRDDCVAGVDALTNALRALTA